MPDCMRLFPAGTVGMDKKNVNAPAIFLQPVDPINSWNYILL